MMNQEGSGPFYQTSFCPAEPGGLCGHKWDRMLPIATRVPEPTGFLNNRRLSGNTREIILIIQ